LPTKTKDLTWFEAQKAWADGWEAANDNDGWVVNFDVNKLWKTEAITICKYRLTGKRR
jgi:hypothetical protein